MKIGCVTGDVPCGECPIYNTQDLVDLNDASVILKKSSKWIEENTSWGSANDAELQEFLEEEASIHPYVRELSPSVSRLAIDAIRLNASGDCARSIAHREKLNLIDN